MLPLGLIAAESAADAGIHQKNYSFENSNIDNFKRRNENYQEIVKPFQVSILVIKVASETIENEAKKTKLCISLHVIRYLRC